MRVTNVADLLGYVILHGNPDIHEPTGFSLFVKGQAEVEIDEKDIQNAKVLTI